MSEYNNMLQTIDAKLGLMSSTVGVTLSAEEIRVLRESLKNLGLPKSTIESPLDKDQMQQKDEFIDLKSGMPGHCYMTLVRTLPSYTKVSPVELSEAVDVFGQALGPEPKGKDLILWLCLLEHVLNGSANKSVLDWNSKDPAAYLNVDTHLKTLAKISVSNYRYQYHDDCGRMHILGSGKDICGCNEILCDHGWAARFILQIITRDGQTVGAEIDLSQLFLGEQEELQMAPSELSVSARSRKNKQVAEALRESVADEHQEAMRKQVSDDMVRMLQGQLNARTETLQNTLEQLIEERNKNATRRTQGSAKSYNSDVLETCSETEEETVLTVGPGDSSSVYDRYNRKFMRPGTVLNVQSGPPASQKIYTMKRANTVLEPVQEVHDLTREFDVVQGFVKTQSMREKERDSLNQVYGINGLAAPFKDKDLNFLMHFHTALDTCGMNPLDMPIDALEHIGTLKSKNPTEELIKQVVNRTFDFDEMCVIANPFKLPYITVGMPITDSCLVKCLSLLQSKYRMAWFDQMKCLSVPKFHREFDTFSKDIVHRDVVHHTRSKPVRRSSRRSDVGSSSESNTNTVKAASQRRRGSSFLGMKM